jgi:hypothetical protein
VAATALTILALMLPLTALALVIFLVVRAGLTAGRIFRRLQG